MIKKITGWLSAAKKYAFAHKIISGIVLVVVLGGGWYTYHLDRVRERSSERE
jgi:hypothetical protein